MAILMKIEVTASTAQYDELNRSIGVDSGNLPEGLISHAVAPDGDKLVIVDIWESEDALNRFFETKAGPAMGQMGIEASEPKILPVYNRFPA